MPGRDQIGPMTGRATGRCSTNATDEIGGRRRGMGRGARCGMGRRRQQGSCPQNRMAGIAALEEK